MNKARVVVLLTVAVTAGAIYSMGCGSSGAPSATDTGTGTATVSSLSSVPSTDLSTYDNSSSSASADISALTKSVTKGLHKVSKGLGENLDAVGNSSRAGCESNMHKKEMIRMSQEAQLDRCYPEAMEKAGFITIPTGSLALYKIAPPSESDEQKQSMCDDIPSYDTERKEACEQGQEGPGGGNILMRIGVIDSQLQIDMCEGAAGSESRVSEATFSASGSTYTGGITRSGNFGGKAEKMHFDMTVDLGTNGTVTEGVVDLGAAGTAKANGQMSGGFGSGAMTFKAFGADASNVIQGGFAGGFTDPLSGAASSFTGRVYSHFGGSSNTGCAKFSFTGTMPPMRVSDMVPFNIAPDQLAGFLQSFGAELGITLTAANYTTTFLCPNKDFNPESSSNTEKPMVATKADGTCEEVTHTGVECFGISNGTQTTDFGTQTVQTFTIIANTGSPFYDEVNAFDIDPLDPTIGTIGFSRAWDCSGEFTTLDFSSFTPTQMQTAMQYMQKCFALEEKLHSNRGMGEYNCGEQEQKNGVQDFAGEGGPDFGRYGGEYTRTAGGNCPPTGLPDKLFADPVNLEANQYCLPLDGNCQAFTVANNATAPSPALTVPGNSTTTITAINYTQAGQDPATAATITYNTAQGSCQALYSINRPTFQAGGTFGGEGGGDAPGEGGFIPTACKDAGLTTESACMQLCEQPNVDCSK